MADITIPPAALEAAARKIAAVTMDMPNVGDRLPDTLWKQYLPEARAALLAGLKAWPGMHIHEWQRPWLGGMSGTDIILPLPTESTDD